MKLYTRTGDDGTTGLFSGARVSKDHPRIEAYGTVDELNSWLGMVAHCCMQDVSYEMRLHEILRQIQSRLFDIGADLATPEGSNNESKIQRIDAQHVAEIEGWIDEIERGTPPMRNFILPGGAEIACRLHVARTVCRRAERLMVALGHSEPVTNFAIQYVNRLSDFLFAAARRTNAEKRIDDVPWQSSRR